MQPLNIGATLFSNCGDVVNVGLRVRFTLHGLSNINGPGVILGGAQDRDEFR